MTESTEELWNAGREAPEQGSFAPGRKMRCAPDGAGVQVQRLSHKHEMILNWLLLNADRSLRECADHFGLTQAWLSSLIHSDLFQLTLRERQTQIALRIADDLPAKLRTLADVAVETLTTFVSESENPEYVLDATDKVLHRMGFAPSSARNPAGSPAQIAAQQNNFFITAGDLHEARQLMSGREVLDGGV